MGDDQKNKIKEAEKDLQRLPEWSELTQEEQNDMQGKLEAFQIESTHDLQGLKKLINQEFTVRSRLSDLKDRIIQIGQKRRLQRLEDEKEKNKKIGKTKISRTVKIPSAFNTVEQLKEIIQRLTELKNDFEIYSDIDVTINIED